MTNPIPMQTRGVLYVTSIIVSSIALIIVSLLQVLDLNVFLPVVTATVAAVSGAASVLARDNLGSTTVEIPEDVLKQWLPYKSPYEGTEGLPDDVPVEEYKFEEV